MESTGKVALVLIVVACILAGYFWFVQKPTLPGGAGNRTRTSAGILETCQFESPEDIATFNDEVRAWLEKRGFTECSDTTYAAVVGEDEWKIPDVLLVNRFDATSHIYVFIPDCYSPSKNGQVIKYHLTLQGTNDIVNKRGRDFQETIQEFQTQFPPDWHVRLPKK